MSRIVCAALLTLVVSLLPSVSSAQHGFDPDEGTLSSVRPHIPEPMVFDLVRPLGAARGELEVNSLVRVAPSRSTDVEWAPEVEYTFANGHGIELELPFANGTLERIKVALQGTLPGPKPRSFIHGWQGIWEGARHGDGTQADLLYLTGARPHRRWSVFTMAGVRREMEHGTTHRMLANASLFLHARRDVSYGLESNFAGKGAAGRQFLLMPQVHLRRSRVNVQVGAGLARTGGSNTLQVAGRVSREF